MAGILRGEIRWADLNPTRGTEQAGQRPVLILTHDVFNERSGTVIAVALTSQPPRAGFPLTLELTTPRLPKRSWVKISQIRTFATERIGNRLFRAVNIALVNELEIVYDKMGIDIWEVLGRREHQALCRNPRRVRPRDLTQPGRCIARDIEAREKSLPR